MKNTKKALLILSLLLIIPCFIGSTDKIGISIPNPFKVVENVLKGDPFNFSGGSDNMHQSLDASIDKFNAVLGGHMNKLTEIQKDFAKQNLVLIDSFNKGNAENLKLFANNNWELMNQFGDITSNFNKSLEAGFNSNIENLSNETQKILEVQGKKLSYSLNVSILFFVFVLFIFFLLILNYGYFLFVLKARRSFFTILKTKNFLLLTGVGLIVILLFYGGLYYQKTEDLNQRIISASLDFKGDG